MADKDTDVGLGYDDININYYTHTHRDCKCIVINKQSVDIEQRSFMCLLHRITLERSIHDDTVIISTCMYPHLNFGLHSTTPSHL